MRWIVVAVLILAIKIFSLFPDAVERYYANGVYPYISSLQRLLTGWLPFSIGDFLYLFAAVYLLKSTLVFGRMAVRKRLTRPILTIVLLRVVYACCVIYIVFNLCWGLNYNRRPILRHLGIVPKAYTQPELEQFVSLMRDRLNANYAGSRLALAALSTNRAVFKESKAAYKEVKVHYPELSYRLPSVKPSIFSYLGNYLGFTGYYNPFSGEAQVNTTVPTFVQPFTTCHEIGHQLGYAKENEANFAGVLSAAASKDTAFRYSLYFDLYSYAIRDLYSRDSARASFFNRSLAPGVRHDFQQLRKFFEDYNNPFEPIIRRVYGRYLQANEQPMGMMSYNEVVVMLISFVKNNGNKAI